MISQITNLKVKECEGCSIRSHCKFKPHYIDSQGNKVECPCQVCLIKVVCRKICDDFKQYTKLMVIEMGKQEIKFKECEGCKEYQEYQGEKIICWLTLEPYYFNKQGNKRVCPCSICLIKGVCVKSCKKIQLYYLGYSKMRRSKGK